MNTTPPTAPGLEVTEYRGLDQILTGNAGIACERGTPTPDTTTCTLPIYPLPSDLPSLQALIERKINGGRP